MTITFQSVFEFGFEQANTLCNQGFADYVIPVQMSVAGLLAMTRQDSVDLTLSRVVFNDGQSVGVAFIARRGWTSRLAAMAIIPEGRAKGVGEACVRQLLTEAKLRGDKTMTLEVIEKNTRAVRLYEKCGFSIARRLVGYTGHPRAETIRLELEEVDIREAARALIAYGPPDLPWQLSGETLAQAGPPAVAYRGEAAYIALSNPAASTISIRALLTVPHARQQGRASKLLRAVIARYPNKEWRISAIWPEELGGLFEKIGLERDQLTQWQMTTKL